MLRLSAFLALAAAGAPLAGADFFTVPPAPEFADVRPETILVDSPEIERVIPSDDAELPDADSDMPDDEDLEYMTYRCTPPWGFRATALYLTRADLNNGPVLRNDINDATILDASQLDFDHQPGVDLSASYSPDDCHGYELRYVWLDDWTAATRLTPLVPLNIASLADTGPLNTTTFDTAYRSRFRSTEANLRQSLGESTLLVGFRYALVDEDLVIHGFGGGTDTFTAFSTQNDLFGLQLGLARDWRPCDACWGVGGFAKAGGYYNAVDVDAAHLLGTVPQGFARDSIGGLSFLGEAGVAATYCVRSNVTLRIGYRLLIIDGIAIASEQIDRTGALHLPNPTLAGHDDGTLFAHGFDAGVEVTW